LKLTRLSENLYSLRKKRGLSQEEFAEKIHISRQAVSKWERGEAYPDTENLIEIASFYGVTLDELVNAEEINERATPERETASDEYDAIEDSDLVDDGGIEFVILPDEDEECDPEDEDDDGEGFSLNASLHFDWSDLPYPIIVTVAYLLLGFLTPRGWEIWWTLFVTIPVYYSVVECIKKRKLSPFAYPVFITFVYLLIGMITRIWSPTWVMYLTIPIYYAIASMIDGRRK